MTASVVTDLQVLISEGRKFATILADPPWRYANGSTRGAARRHYGTMSTEAICQLPIADIADDRALLWLWTTTSFLTEALTRVIPAWGFQYKSEVIWCKPQLGLGNYVRLGHEHLLIASRGGLRPDGRNQRSWVEAPRGRHSAKPHVFRHIIESISPAPRIELFGREARPGWTVWGDQIDRQTFLEATGDADVLARVLGHVGPVASRTQRAEAIRMALRDPEATKLSDRQIAEHLGVSHPFVGKIRRQLTEATGNGYQSARRIGRDGRTIDTAKIGRKVLQQQDQGPESPGKTSVSAQ